MISRPGRNSFGSQFPAGGFSLVELLVVTAIVAILLGVALPGYERQMLRVKRTTALAVLEQLRARQERFFVHHHRYAETFNELGFASEVYAIDAEGRAVEPDSRQRSYRITLTAATGLGYQLRAIAQLRQRRDARCQELAVDGRGAREAQPGAVEECW
ncbi:prepilin-type N-terminal cleavage/methylation domain-containing protein [Parahaliea maris]|uniref:Prepilin-type N-terminal cleavage/methylation domain-containing protein n=1 Tax=Parahaliea maris TaxID=2716870 RepID=A0A5C8ZVC4_9GAMM|nr:type IV pilin protein [Parahaliea maris]TXS91417.1 prepilin-type N-terminal cleavage/methylation domain-containing protein [Parahaliea maris]